MTEIIHSRYRTIVADPPWPYPEGFVTTAPMAAKGKNRPHKRRPLPYPPMSLEDIARLPLVKLADDDCRLFCWTTNRYLPDTFPLLTGWGFRYRQTLVWHRTDGSPFPGSVAGRNAEFLLVAVRGKPPRLSTIPSSVIAYSYRQLGHSRKPECFLDYIEQVSPGPYLELFARRNRLGWDTWGNEALEHVELS